MRLRYGTKNICMTSTCTCSEAGEERTRASGRADLVEQHLKDSFHCPRLPIISLAIPITYMKCYTYYIYEVSLLPKMYCTWSRCLNHQRSQPVFPTKRFGHPRRLARSRDGPRVSSPTSITTTVMMAVTAMLAATSNRDQNCSLPLCTWFFWFASLTGKLTWSGKCFCL